MDTFVDIVLVVFMLSALAGLVISTRAAERFKRNQAQQHSHEAMERNVLLARIAEALERR